MNQWCIILRNLAHYDCGSSISSDQNRDEAAFLTHHSHLLDTSENAAQKRVRKRTPGQQNGVPGLPGNSLKPSSLHLCLTFTLHTPILTQSDVPLKVQN